MFPSGRVTVTGHTVGLTSSMTLASFNDMKFPVVPVSAFARVAFDLGSVVGVEGGSIA